MVDQKKSTKDESANTEEQPDETPAQAVRRKLFEESLDSGNK